MKLILFAALSAAVGVGSFILTQSVKVKAQRNDRKPFTVIMVENQYNGDEKQPVHTHYYLFAVRGDGTQVQTSWVQSPRGKWMQPKTIVDFSAKKLVSVVPFAESLSTLPLSEGVTSWYPSQPRKECTADPNLERSTLLDYEVRKVHKQFLGPPESEISVDFFMAPALDCFALREEATIGPAAAPRTRMTRQPLFVLEGKPAPSLFEIPSDYVERSPSEVAAEFERRYPEQPMLSDHGRQVLDEVYHGARQPKR